MLLIDWQLYKTDVQIQKIWGKQFWLVWNLQQQKNNCSDYTFKLFFGFLKILNTFHEFLRDPIYLHYKLFFSWAGVVYIQRSSDVERQSFYHNKEVRFTSFLESLNAPPEKWIKMLPTVDG